MTHPPETIPLDDRAWPRAAPAISVCVGLAACAGGVASALVAAGRGPYVLGAAVVGFGVALAGAFALSGRAFRHRIAGRPIPPGITAVEVGFVLVTGIVLFAVSGVVGSALYAGAITGLMAANLRAVRAARANRPVVEAAEAAAAAELEGEESGGREETRPAEGEEPVVPLGLQLSRALGDLARRWTAWVVAGMLALGGGRLTGWPEGFAVGVAVIGGMGLAWTTRRLWALFLARRAYPRDHTAAHRAFVVVLRDPNPYGFRPLLAVWTQEPEVIGGRLTRPERVFRCDDLHDRLESRHGNVVVHETWVDTGRRPRSKPRWVAADAGVVLPHRGRLVFGGWYLSLFLRAERPEPPALLGRPQPGSPEEQRAAWDAEPAPRGRWLTAVAWRVVGLAASGGIVAWFA